MPQDQRIDDDMLPSYERVAGEFKFLGPIGGMNPDSRLWVGGIGLNREHGQWALDELKRHQHELDSFYTTCKPGAPKRCGDERGRESFIDAVYEEAGPMSVGAEAADALVYGLVRGHNVSPAQDVRALAAAEHQAGSPFEPGGHIDEAGADHNGGCGGIKEQPRIVGLMARRERELERQVRGLMGDSYSPAALGRIAEASQRLEARKEEYYGGDYQNSFVETIRETSQAPKPIYKVKDKHYAVAVMINTVPWTTLNTDLMSEALSRPGRPVQAFGYDAWWPPIQSKYLFPGDDEAQLAFIAGVHANNVAGLMYLTDGSIEAGVRQAA